MYIYINTHTHILYTNTNIYNPSPSLVSIDNETLICISSLVFRQYFFFLLLIDKKRTKIWESGPIQKQLKIKFPPTPVENYFLYIQQQSLRSGSRTLIAIVTPSKCETSTRLNRDLQ